MTINCVFFDLDNTLTDRRASITNFTRRFATHFGDQLGAISFADLEAAMQRGDNLGYKPKPDMFNELIHELPWHMPVATDAIRDFWYAVSPGCMQPRPGLFPTLSTLQRNGIRIGMITNGWTHVQNATIDALKVRDFMETIVISEAAGIRKPDVGIFKLALTNLGVQPYQTIYVGDHPHSDMVGAAGAGAGGVWVRTGGHPWPADQPAPDHIIDELPEILDLLRG